MSHSRIRQRVVDYLALHGSFDDPGGRATAKLREALEYEGSAAGFTQLIAAMDRTGDLTRNVKGKRTYRIAATTDHSLTRDESTSVEETAGMSEMDYDQVAAALLVRVVQTLSSGSGQRGDDGSWARRRIERLERRIGELESDLLSAKAEARARTDERDSLRSQLEHSEGNLALLTDRFANGKPKAGSVSNRLQADERALLHQLRSGASRARPDRAS